MPIPLVIINGFLGAGKTTLLIAAARRIIAAGKKAAVITNDQGVDLVDTAFARSAGLAAGEITGGCFCCRFSDFVDAAGRLERGTTPDVILAEPVGSCTDLAATVLRPLQQLYAAQFRVAPLTVVVEPARAAQLSAPDADPLLAYLFRKQIAEADIVCETKCDLASGPASLPEVLFAPGRTTPRHRVSAVTGEGVGAWLADVLEGRVVAASKLLEIDYGRYAEAEARLGWLNWSARLRAREPRSAPAVVGPWLDSISEELDASGIAIAHLKALDNWNNGGGTLKVSMCRNGEQPAIDGDLLAPAVRRHDIILNLRAAGAPERLREIVERAAALLPGTLSEVRCEAFRPSPPKPEHRLASLTQDQDN
jgi:hypothetical protein